MTTSFGQRLRLIRKASGLTQTDLAKAVGVSKRVISYYERNEGNAPTADLIAKFADILKVSSDELLGLTEIKSIDGRTRYGRIIEKLNNLPSDDQKMVCGMIDKLTIAASH